MLSNMLFIQIFFLFVFYNINLSFIVIMQIQTSHDTGNNLTNISDETFKHE